MSNYIHVDFTKKKLHYVSLVKFAQDVFYFTKNKAALDVDISKKKHFYTILIPLQDPLFGLESELELVDHSFDGREDGGSGHLRAGLGQLADGRFGGDGPMEEEGEEEVVGPGEGKRKQEQILFNDLRQRFLSGTKKNEND